ncbi:Lymphoid enhancer-binding factor 1 [Acipenser ruthenus]|uniref:Lymphoid enhancer-binding factor 1 n=1 Tax=Acipenser ruthenus TaxID=7906 RepID=A0A444TXS0_ACIRT|nr:Lymphoid enhancer-binding factor 1 [Acipenser ruthenus]
MPQLAGGGGGGGDPELCANDEMIPFKDEGDPQKEKIFAEISHSEEEGDLADIKSSLVNESEINPNSNNHEAARQVLQDSYHEKHREHCDDGKHQDSLYNKGHPYPGYPGYIMMSNMNNDSYMPNGALSPSMVRTAARQVLQDSYHEKHREHCDDGKHQDSLYNKGHPYPGYPGYIMMSNMNNDSYMPNGALSPSMVRTQTKSKKLS